MRVLRVAATRVGEVGEVVRFLTAVETAYAHAFAFDLIVVDAIDRYRGGDAMVDGRPAPARKSLQTIAQPAEVVLPEDRLRLSTASVAPGGHWGFAGALNPLQTLGKFLDDRQALRHDGEPDGRFGAEGLVLDNEKIKTGVVREQIALLRDIGVPEDRIRRAVSRHIVQPLSSLEEFQDSRLIGGATVADVAEREA